MDSGDQFSKTFAKVFGINVGVLLVYSVLIYVVRNQLPIHDVFFATTMLLLVGFQTMVCLVASLVYLVNGKRHQAKAYLMSALWVGLGGGCLCYGAAR